MAFHRKFERLDGAVRLRAFFVKEASKADGWTQVALARHLGMSANSVYFWCCGFRRPSQQVREALKRIARIPPSAWMTDADRSAAKRLRAA